MLYWRDEHDAHNVKVAGSPDHTLMTGEGFERAYLVEASLLNNPIS
jgi:hypothetical protein